MKKHFRALELDKIIAKLMEKVVIDKARERVEAIEPSYSFEEVKRLIEQTSDALMLSLRFGAPRFVNLKDPETYIKRCKAGGVLSNSELLSIASILRQTRSLCDWKGQTEVHSCLDELFEVLCSHRQVEERIFSAIISEEEIADTASDELFSIRQKNQESSNENQRSA